MPVECRDAAAMIDDDRVAVARDPARIGDGAALRRMDGHAVVAADIEAAMEALIARNRVRAPTEFRSNRPRDRPDHRAAARDRHIGVAVPDHALDLFRGGHELIVLPVEDGLIGLHLVDEILALLHLLLHDLAGLARLELLLRLLVLILGEFLLRLLDILFLLKDRLHEVIVLLDDALQKIHAREEIREILRAKEYVEIGNLAVDVDVAHALAEALALHLVLALRHAELRLVVRHTGERFVERCLCLFVVIDGRIGLLIKCTLFLGNRRDAPLDLIALLLLLRRAVLVVGLLVIERIRPYRDRRTAKKERCQHRRHELFT